MRARYFLILQAFSDIMAANPRPGTVVDFYISADRVYCDSCILLMLQMLAFCESRDITMRMHATSTPVNGIIRPTSGRWLSAHPDIVTIKGTITEHVTEWFKGDYFGVPLELTNLITNTINNMYTYRKGVDKTHSNIQDILDSFNSWGDN